MSYTTTLPPQQPTLDEWLKEFKVGHKAPKHDNRAMDMMRQWGKPGVGPGFATVIAKLKLPS
jgi:hypothetical protein